MSRKKPVRIKLRENYEVNPEFAYRGDVVKSGSGAVVKSFKKFIGKKATVIIEEDKVPYNEDIAHSAGTEGWS